MSLSIATDIKTWSKGFAAPVQAVVDVLASIDRNDIRYCHWKSNVRLDRSFANRTDFDLLVARTDAARLEACLQECGLKRRYSTADKVFPGIEDYLGFDETTGEFFHFHVHYSLVVGRKGQKNYRLPLEEEVLNSSIQDADYPIRIIRPALEFVVFVLRAFVKADFNLRSAVRSALGRSVFPRQVLDEFSGLAERASIDEVVEVCRDKFPELESVIPAFARRRGWENSSNLELRQIKRRIVRALKPYRLFVGDELRAESAGRHMAAHHSRSWLPTGGLSVAFIGADGSGKSSTVKEVASWLGWKLSVASIYMGIPKDRKDLVRWKRLSRLADRLHLQRLRHAFMARHWLAVARSRQHNARLGARLKGRGCVALFDRYPLQVFWMMDAPMDGPRLDDSSPYAQRERDLYESIEPVDHIFVLSTTEALSVERKPELRRHREALKQKIDAVDQFAASGDEIITIINTARGHETCLLEIKRVLWGLL